jgi:hypothetical protein
MLSNTTIRQEKGELNHPVSQEMPSMTASRLVMDEMTKEVMGLKMQYNNPIPTRCSHFQTKTELNR